MNPVKPARDLLLGRPRTVPGVPRRVLITGAASGLGQCHLRMNRPHAALRALAQALDLNPTLELAQTIQSLRQTLGDA